MLHCSPSIIQGLATNYNSTNLHTGKSDRGRHNAETRGHDTFFNKAKIIRKRITSIRKSGEYISLTAERVSVKES